MGLVLVFLESKTLWKVGYIFRLDPKWHKCHGHVLKFSVNAKAIFTQFQFGVKQMLTAFLGGGGGGMRCSPADGVVSVTFFNV